MNETLKDCPFCGSQPNEDGYEIAYCRSCGAEASFGAWNRRATDPQVAPLVEAVEGFLKQVDDIAAKQRALLIDGQTFETASENWDEATATALDVTGLREALRKHKEALGEKEDPT